MVASTSIRFSHRDEPSFDHVAMVHVVNGSAIGRREIRFAYGRYELHASTREPPIALVQGSPGPKEELNRCVDRQGVSRANVAGLVDKSQPSIVLIIAAMLHTAEVGHTVFKRW